MLVSYPNDVKIYNLSAGKSLPEWISDRKKRKLLQEDVDLRRRIELIQDFDMPDCSSCVTMSKNDQFVFVCGTYKPRVKCYDVCNLSMKFERCMNAEAIKAITLSDGYEKILFLQEERWLEFHVQYGQYFRLRIPKFGRDMIYNETNCDLYVTGSGNEIYRLNLEQGRFMTPFTSSQASSFTKCDLNVEYQLLVCGTWEGCVEAWDARSKTVACTLDAAKALLAENIRFKDLPSVSSIKLKDKLKLAVGTASGQVLMYDIRSNKPYLVKDHNCDLPIRCVEFSKCDDQRDLVVSMDKRAVKLWREDGHGQPYTTVEPGVDLNDLCLIKNTGLFFMANENQKVLTYYIPGLGPAPRWCSFLDNITEELEETEQPEVYDDYKFLTPNELEELGLSHLIGSKLLRVYMHGYFIDARLYNKAKALTNPLAHQEYRKQKIKDALDKERTSRVQIKQKLPRVNKELAQRLTHEESGQNLLAGRQKKQKKKEKQTSARSLLADERFAQLFENPDFEVDKSTEEFRLLNPAVARLERQKSLKKKKRDREVDVDQPEEREGRTDQADDHVDDGASTSSSEDDNDYRQLVREAHRDVKDRRRAEAWSSAETEREQQGVSKKLLNRPFEIRADAARLAFEIKTADDEDFKNWARELSKPTTARQTERKHDTLESRLGDDDSSYLSIIEKPGGGREMSFDSKKLIKSQERQRKVVDHVKERRKLRRSAATLQHGKKFNIKPYN